MAIERLDEAKKEPPRGWFEVDPTWVLRIWGIAGTGAVKVVDGETPDGKKVQKIHIGIVHPEVKYQGHVLTGATATAIIGTGLVDRDEAVRQAKAQARAQQEGGR